MPHHPQSLDMQDSRCQGNAGHGRLVRSGQRHWTEYVCPGIKEGVCIRGHALSDIVVLHAVYLAT